MKTRNLSELYSIVLDYRKTLTLGDSNQFICNAIEMCNSECLISKEEFSKLFRHFRKNRPTSKLHREFYNLPTYTRSSAWWHLCGDCKEGVVIRDRFLEKLIRITKRS